MKIIPITDSSHEVLEKLVSELFGEDAAKTLLLFQKVPNPFLIMDGSRMAGYLNLKQVEGTIYIPIYFKELPVDADVSVFTREIKSILTKHHYKYFVLVLRKPLTGFLDTLTKYICVEDSVRDYCREGNQQIYDVEKGEYQWIDTIADVSALKALHADAYSYEKEYVVGTWDDLIDRFLSCQTPKITICCYSGTRLIGSVIGFMYDSYNYIYSICVANEYQGKGIGSGLMRCFVNASQGKAIQLRVYSNNHMAWTMYEHFGFEFVELSALVGSTGSLL